MNFERFSKENIKTSGALSREIYFSENYNGIYLKICEFSRNNFFENYSFKERLYRFFNSDESEKNCVCSSPLKFKSVALGFSQYCSTKCANSNTQSKIKLAKLEKYGDPHYNNKEKFRNTVKNRSEEQKKTSLERRRNTKKNLYGDENYTNVNKIQGSKKNTTLLNINNKIREYQCEAIDVSYGAYLIKCNKCGEINNVLNSRLNTRIRNNQDVCIKCNDYNSGVSNKEIKISDFIDSLGIPYERGNKKILNGKEIDILFPHLNIGIEFNGLFWHSEYNHTNNYHYEKTEKAEESGINLIHIWEDDWDNKRDIVKSRIVNLLNLPNRKINARACEIRKVNYRDAQKFLNENHLQGSCPFKIAIGLFYEDEIISLATFGKRKISGSSEEELLRFANKIFCNIPGAFSKILKHYINNYKKGPLISFADRCWTKASSNVYLKNGFRFIGKTQPSYYYIVDHVRKHRFNFRKDKLIKEGFDPNKTEREIMQERGLFRIYDSGQLKYILD